MTLTELLADVEEHLIGLWRFRERGKPKTWAATYCYRGHYYDVQGTPTPEDTLRQVRKNLRRLRTGR
jgi:hypothetical protein